MEEENEKKKRNFTIILGLITVVIYVGIFFIVDSSEKETNKKNAKPVTNYSEFYTVSSCANLYINALASKNTKTLLNLLTDSYKKKNFITESNVVDSLPIIAGGSEFSAHGMYYEKSKKEVYKYYVRGYLEVGGLDMNERSRVETYLIVYLDKENNLYSIEPYDGLEFKEGTFA